MAVTTIPTPKNQSKSNTTFAGQFRTENVPITPQQSARLRAGESPTAVLGAAVAPPVVSPLAKTTITTSGTTLQRPQTPGPQALAIKAAGGDLNAPFKTEQLDPSGLSRGADGQWMYGGPTKTVVPFPWRTPEILGPVVPLPATTQPIPATITPIPSTPVTKREDIPITNEQEQRLRAGEDPGQVLGSNILPQVPQVAPLTPSGTPESVGPPTITPLGQLNNPPWSPLDNVMIPDNMGHVVTDAELMALLEPQVPENSWESHTLRFGWENVPTLTGIASSSPPDSRRQEREKAIAATEAVVPPVSVAPPTLPLVPPIGTSPPELPHTQEGSDDKREAALNAARDSLSGQTGAVATLEVGGQQGSADWVEFVRENGRDPFNPGIEANFRDAEGNFDADRYIEGWAVQRQGTMSDAYFNYLEKYGTDPWSGKLIGVGSQHELAQHQAKRDGKFSPAYWRFVNKYGYDPITGEMIFNPADPGSTGPGVGSGSQSNF